MYSVHVDTDYSGALFSVVLVKGALVVQGCYGCMYIARLFSVLNAIAMLLLSNI